MEAAHSRAETGGLKQETRQKRESEGGRTAGNQELGSPQMEAEVKGRQNEDHVKLERRHEQGQE